MMTVDGWALTGPAYFPGNDQPPFGETWERDVDADLQLTVTSAIRGGYIGSFQRYGIHCAVETWTHTRQEMQLIVELAAGVFPKNEALWSPQ